MKAHEVWTPEYQEIVWHLGWGLFTVTRASGDLHFEIQKVDETGMFSSDHDAVRNCVNRAATGRTMGDALCLKALMLHQVQVTQDVFPEDYTFV